MALYSLADVPQSTRSLTRYAYAILYW